MKTRVSIFTILMILILPLFLQNSYACSCSAPTDFLAALQESEYAFIGTVTDIDNSGGPQKVTFYVTQIFKGDIKDNIFVLENLGLSFSDEYTTSKHSSCDVGYQIGITYTVFVHDNVHYNNGMCDTKPIGFLGLGLLNPFDYNLFYYVVLGMIVGSIIVIIRWKKRK
ncbi:hypothetical protein [Nitrosopumilus piranensis]|uniref:CbiN domain protein n=1 Tax=Nitrosopumilus piranensis TaxID=1582439 RepID=A0A0C5C184_9ARCH|nr:hypothetical protein [Nitrosopumilus piranensis]AJM93095.1 exported protein of unknown function [Nitrosopumilus piranensis]